MFISSKDILHYWLWCNTVHALIIIFYGKQSSDPILKMIRKIQFLMTYGSIDYRHGIIERFD